MTKPQWVVYLVQCSDKSLYCGITNNLENRLAEHNSGKGAKYTRSRRPVTLVVTSSQMTRSDALKLEYRVKQVPSTKKEFELKKKGDEITMNIKKELLHAVLKQVKALSNTIEKMIKEADKAEKAAKKKAPNKKTVVKKKAESKKKTAVKKTTKKATGEPTAFDQVVDAIKKSKSGVDNATLIKKTGFDAKKIANIIYKAKNKGQIKATKKGVYTKA